MQPINLSNQYLDKNTLLNEIQYNKIEITDLISNDSYHEQMITDKFNTYPKEVQGLLLKCAIHIAIIGYGNKTYGMIRDNDGNIISIQSIFDKYGICYNKNLNEKYDKDTISARRLIRLLRYHIQRFILETGRPSYLWLKYSNKDINKISICFPGGEHLVSTIEDANYMLLTYKNLDIIMGSKFVTRLRRVFMARGICPPEMIAELAIEGIDPTINIRR